MVNKDVVRVIFGITGNVISICLFASEVPTFYKAVKKCNSVEGINPNYYLAMTMNCLFLVLYGVPFIHPGNLLLLTAFGTGLAIYIAYLTIFLLYASKQRVYVGSVLLTELLVIGLVSGLLIGLGHTVGTRTMSVGFFCFFIGIFVLAPRGELAAQVTDTKSVECMSFPIALGDTLNGLCWCIYAALGSDTFFMVPNGLGCAWGLYHLILYYVYRSSITPKCCDVEKLAETADKELAEAEHDKELPEEEHDKELPEEEHWKLALELHDDFQQGVKLAQAQLAQVELDLAKAWPSNWLDELDIV